MEQAPGNDTVHNWSDCAGLCAGVDLGERNIPHCRNIWEKNLFNSDSQGIEHGMLASAPSHYYSHGLAFHASLSWPAMALVDIEFARRTAMAHNSINLDIQLPPSRPCLRHHRGTRWPRLEYSAEKAHQSQTRLFLHEGIQLVTCDAETSQCPCCGGKPNATTIQHFAVLADQESSITSAGRSQIKLDGPYQEQLHLGKYEVVIFVAQGPDIGRVLSHLLHLTTRMMQDKDAKQPESRWYLDGFVQ